MPATLSLTLGAPATFGAFTPGVAREYTASTTATVISTAGDATLTVADPSTTAPGRLVNGSFALAQPLQASGRRGVLAADRDAEDLVRARLQRRGRDHVPPADRGERAAAHGRRTARR